MKPIETFTTALSVRNIVARYKASAENLSLSDFTKKVESLPIGDIRIEADTGASIGDKATLFVNFYNIPKDNHSRVDEANNRQAFTISGFDPKNINAPAPGKLSISVLTSALDKQYKLRAKTSTPQDILKYLEKHLKRVVDEVKPRLQKAK